MNSCSAILKYVSKREALSTGRICHASAPPTGKKALKRTMHYRTKEKIRFIGHLPHIARRGTAAGCERIHPTFRGTLIATLVTKLTILWGQFFKHSLHYLIIYFIFVWSQCAGVQLASPPGTSRQPLLHRSASVCTSKQGAALEQ